MGAYYLIDLTITLDGSGITICQLSALLQLRPSGCHC